MNNCTIGKTRRGWRCVKGPSALVKVGPLTVDGVECTITKVGKVFDRNGVECRYGYGTIPEGPSAAETDLRAELDAVKALLVAAMGDDDPLPLAAE